MHQRGCDLLRSLIASNDGSQVISDVGVVEINPQLPNCHADERALVDWKLVSSLLKREPDQLDVPFYSISYRDHQHLSLASEIAQLLSEALDFLRIACVGQIHFSAVVVGLGSVQPFLYPLFSIGKACKMNEQMIVPELRLAGRRGTGSGLGLCMP